MTTKVTTPRQLRCKMQNLEPRAREIDLMGPFAHGQAHAGLKLGLGVALESTEFHRHMPLTAVRCMYAICN